MPATYTKYKMRSREVYKTWIPKEVGTQQGHNYRLTETFWSKFIIRRSTSLQFLDESLDSVDTAGALQWIR